MSASHLVAIKEAMQPLTQQFNLRVVGESDLSNWSEVDYGNNTTGLSVAIDWSEFRPFVRIGELIQGVLPLAPTSIKDAEHIKSFDVDDILLIRVKGGSPVGKMLGARDDQAVERLMREYAVALKLHAADILSGDFVIFPELTRIVKARFDEMRPRTH